MTKNQFLLSVVDPDPNFQLSIETFKTSCYLASNIKQPLKVFLSFPGSLAPNFEFASKN